MNRAWTRTNKALAVFALMVVCSLPWIKFNLTASAPRGVWTLHRVPVVVERDMWVTLPVPPVAKRYGPRWAPLLKQVAAVAGELVCVTDETLWIRGLSYGRVYSQVQGQPFPHLEEGCFTVEAGSVFLASQAAQSLDSRYFSSVAIADITAVATPLWAERKAWTR